MKKKHNKNKHKIKFKMVKEKIQITKKINIIQSIHNRKKIKNNSNNKIMKKKRKELIKALIIM